MTPEHEDDPGTDEVDPKGTRRDQMTSLAEKIASLDKEKRREGAENPRIGDEDRPP